MTNPMMNIRNIRKKQGLKQEFMARKLGISTSYLSELERGKKRISLSDYVNILDILGYEI